jgi:hypothetical protein
MLVILIGAAYWLKIPKLIYPLFGLYLIFLFFTISEINTKNKAIPNNKQEITIKQNPKNEEAKTKESVIQDTIKKKPIKPKQIVFEDNSTLFKDKLKNKNLGQTQKIVKIIPEQNKINVKKMVICKNIINRRSIQPGKTFNNTVDSLYCYTIISNSGGKQHLTHIWEYDNQVMSKIKYTVKQSLNWRSWTRKTILPHQTGLWTVSVEDTSGAILKSIQFHISNSIND